MNLNRQELELLRQALYSKAYKIEQQINKSYAKTGPSARLDKKGQELDEVTALLERVQKEITEQVIKNW